MTQAADTLPKLTLERTLTAPRDLIWHAWTDPAALARWWGPTGFANPRCEIDARTGGVIRIDMLGPDGTIYPMDGRIENLEAPRRLEMITGAIGPDGKRLFDVRTILELEEVAGGTRLRLDVRVTAIHNPAAPAYLSGMKAGWTQSLERLAASCAQRPTVFGEFTLERQLKASPERVFAAFADEASKAAWFVAPAAGWTLVERSMDVRVGGRERLIGRWASGVVTEFDAVYQDVVPGRRLVYSYAMHVNNVRISVALAVIEVAPDGAGSHLTITEQGAFLDGYDDAGLRRRGTSDLLDQLERSMGE
jgi:uncharacterized protein YndB with AHSA1/START domain